MLYLSSFPTVYTKVLSSGLCEAEACGIKETVQTHKSYQVSLIWPFSLSLYSVLIFAYFLYLQIRPVKLQEQLLTMQALISSHLKRTNQLITKLSSAICQHDFSKAMTF